MEEKDILVAVAEEDVEKPKRSRRSKKNINLDERNGPKADGENVTVAKKTTGEPKPLAPDTEGLITVRGRVEPNVFAILEMHEGHPDGRLRVQGTEEAKAWPTRKVMEAMYDGRLERV